MALSGSVNYNNTRNDIINTALRKCGQLAEGETATPQQLNDAANDLERLIKLWQSMDLHLWKYQECVLFLINNTNSYNIGESGGNFVTLDDLNTVYLASSSSSGDSTITVTDDDDITDGDYIGVVVDGNTIHWTTVNGTPVDNVVTLTTVLDDDATSGNTVYTYINKAFRPLGITSARVQLSTTNELVMIPLSRNDYFALPNKLDTGTPTQYYYQPALTNGLLYLNPTVNNETYYLNLSCKMPIEDFDSADNNPDLPVEWCDALIWNLAKKIAPEYGLDPTRWQMIQAEAKESLDMVSGFDTEDESVIIGVDLQ